MEIREISGEALPASFRSGKVQRGPAEKNERSPLGENPSLF
jgi:hypothetical protein